MMNCLCYDISMTLQDDVCHGIRADGSIDGEVVELGPQSFATDVLPGDQLQFDGKVWSVEARRQVQVPEAGSAMLLMLVELEADQSNATMGDVVRGSFTDERQVPAGAPFATED